MTDYTDSAPIQVQSKQPRDWLALSAKTWFIVTAVGQWLFVAYILVYFGGKFLSGGIPAFGETHLPNGFVPGDSFGNMALVIHILLAGLIIAAGQIQLMPVVRSRIPRLHRWSGRFYLVAASFVSIAGLYLGWSRERLIGSIQQDIGTSLGGVLVLIFMPIVLYYVRKRNFAAHRRWALRFFMAVSAVWFLRLIIFGWFLTTGGIGIDAKTFSGPFLTFANFAQVLLPLAVLELFFRAERTKSQPYRRAVASLIFVLTGMMAVGIFAVTAGFWLPAILA